MFNTNTYKLLLALTTLVSVPTAAAATEPAPQDKNIEFHVHPVPPHAQCQKLCNTIHKSTFDPLEYDPGKKFTIGIPLQALTKAKNDLNNNEDNISVPIGQNILNQAFQNANIKVSVKAIYRGTINNASQPLDGDADLTFTQLTDGNTSITISTDVSTTTKICFGIMAGLLLASGALYAYFSGAQEDTQTTESPKEEAQNYYYAYPYPTPTLGPTTHVP